MKVTTSKSKNSESFYISKSFLNDKVVSTFLNVRKIGTLTDLLKEHWLTRDDVMKWARTKAKVETQKYKEDKIVNISFNSSKRLHSQQQVFYRGGYLFLQYFYYKRGLNKVCKKIMDINITLSLISINKKLNVQYRQWDLCTKGFKSLYDDKVVDLTEISKEGKTISYKDAPYAPKDLSSHIHPNIQNTKSLL